MTDLRQKGYAIEVLLERGLARLKTGAAKNALQLWDEALQIDPDEPRALTYIDYVRQNWDEVDGCIDPPVPDVSDLRPNYAIEPEPRPGNVQAPVSGGIDSAVLEAKRVEAVAALEAKRAEAEALEAKIAAAREELARIEAAAAAVPVATAIPQPIHDLPTPRGTVEFRLGGVGGDGWGLAPEPMTRQPAARATHAPAVQAPIEAAAAAIAEASVAAASGEPAAALALEEAAGEGLRAPAVGDIAATEVEIPVPPIEALTEAPGEAAIDAPLHAAGVAPAGAASDGISTTDSAMAPAIGPIFPEDAVTHPRIPLPSQAELDALADEATRTYPRRLAAAAVGLADHGAAASETADAARESADAAADAEEAAIARTATPLLAGRTPTPMMPGRAILGAPDGLMPSLAAISDADFERDLEEALGAAADELGGPGPSSAAPVLEGSGDAVPTAIGDDGFDDDDLDLDLPPPVAEAAPVGAPPEPAPVGLPLEAAPLDAAFDATAADAATADVPLRYANADGDPFGEEARPTVWSPPPTNMPAPVLTPALSLAERVEQAMARELNPFADERVTTSWQAPPAALLAQLRAAPEAAEPEPVRAEPEPVRAAPVHVEPQAVHAEPEPVRAEAVHVDPEVAAAAEADGLHAEAEAVPETAEALAEPAAAGGLHHALDELFAAADPLPGEPAAVAPPAVAAEPSTAEPDLGAELAAALMADELPPSATVPASSSPVFSPPPESIFDRVTTILPIAREDLADAAPGEARATSGPLPRLTAQVPAAHAPESIPAAQIDIDDIELAPRSGVGLGADTPVRLDQREISTTIDDIGPLAHSGGPPGSPPPVTASLPPVELSAAEAEEMALDDSDLLSDDDETGENPPAATRVPTLPLIAPPAVSEADVAAARATTRELGPIATSRTSSPELVPSPALEPRPHPPSEPPLPVSASSEIRLPSPIAADRDAIGSFDGPEAQTVTVMPESLELASPPPAAAPPAADLLTDEDPFELPTAPITPIEPSPHAAATIDLRHRVPAPPVPDAVAPMAAAAAAAPDAIFSGGALERTATAHAGEEHAPSGPRAKTLELMPSSTAPLWAPAPPATAPAADAYLAETADLTPRFPAPPHDLAAPVPVAAKPRDVDTADLGPAWSAPTADELAGGRRLEPAPAWGPPPTGSDGGDAPPLPEPPRSAPPADPMANLRRGDEVWASDAGERLGARLSPQVLRGLGLTPMAERPLGERPTTDEPTRDGWPTGRRPAAPSRPPAESPAAFGSALDAATLDDLTAQTGPLDDLELPTPRPGTGTRTPGEVLLRSSAPEALAAAIASELDRGAPAGESADERARRRITALLERASAAARAGEYPMSIAAIDLALSEAPDSAVAQKLVHRSRDIILDCYTRYFGDLQRRPVPVGSLTELTGRPLDPRAAFLVSRMDGTLTYEEILNVAGMGRLEACRHLAQLLVRGIIRAT